MSAPRALIVDAFDPPLGAAERVVSIAAAEAVLRGLGRAAMEYPRAALRVEASDDGARRALAVAADGLGANVEIAAASRPLAVEALRLRPSALAEASWAASGAPARCVVAVAGALGAPRVFAAPPELTIGELVAQAEPSTAAWVALWGGAHGPLVDRELTVGELVADGEAARLLLVLPTGHSLARRARLPLSAWLRRAQSACAGCGICAPACPASIAVPELLRTLTMSARPRASQRLAAAVDCTACGACDVACPQAISPARIIDDLGRRLRAGGVIAPKRRMRPAAMLDRSTALARLGLARYARAAPSTLDLI